MFRNPRENAAIQQVAVVLPSTGRPPTPPLTGATAQSPYFAPASSLLPRQSPSATPQFPVIGRPSSLKISSGKKNASRPNQSILSFFGKAERVENTPRIIEETGLFFEENSPAKSLVANQSPLPFRDDEVLRYNEETTPIKRRKINVSEDDMLLRTPSPERGITAMISRSDVDVAEASITQKPPQKRRGGFVDDSSDEEDQAVEEDRTSRTANNHLQSRDINDETHHEAQETITQMNESIDRKMVEVVETTKVPLKPPGDEHATPSNRESHDMVEDVIPTLHREATSMVAPNEFGDDDEFGDVEFFEEGEEFMERRWMEEQRAMEASFDEDSKSESGTEGPRTPSANTIDEGNEADTPAESVAMCPICNGTMRGLSETEASTHVNACLDGTVTPLTSRAPETASIVSKPAKSLTPQFSGSAKRFQRSREARPAQSNPFAMMSDSKSKGSAFNRLMSGHAEDAAWAEAAANEQQSRGKPAYQRTCPFYKIMSGLYICVDAFRYGKVEGQNAYFLSHFHSDHYIGLTSSWCHGPIYASKISCNLMRQQLRVDSKWLRPLEFEKRTELPDTQGVFVTMIPANHCPGSSLYLFEKVVGKNKDGTPKLNRILHCGDFRACPAHVKHPLLRPDVLDSISGQTRQQVIDTCYLDTTYLTPKYSFPSQSDVIDACAQMCVSLAKELPDDNDSWEKVKMAKAGSVMTKFLDEGKNEIIKKEEEETEDKKPRIRGRLLVVCGTYSIGKERICMGIAKALNSKIYAPSAKMRICKALEDDELNALLTSNPLDAQVHMQMLMEIRAETLHDYLITFKGHFHRVVGFRPTGWTYRPPTSRFTDNPAVSTVLHSEGWKSRFTMKDLAPQRGSTKESNCFGVPYSEHSSFRELTMFCCALRINRIIPTVNVGSAKSRERMKGWIEKWDMEKKKVGLFKVEVGAEGWGSGDGKLRYGV